MADEAVAFAAASATALALHELHAPTTSHARRVELQALLHRERANAASDAALRSIWRRVLLSSKDELLLWFALSTCEAYLKADAAVSTVPAAERVELKAGLIELLLGATAITLPRSARSKGILVLAQLARAAWPTEEPSFMSDIIGLLQTPGARRELGGKLLAAIADEFAAADAREKQAVRHAAFVSLLPVAYAALADALQDESSDALLPHESPDALVACLDGARALLGFGRLRDGGERMASRSFTSDETAALPALLGAVCNYLAVLPTRATPASAAAATCALGLLAELCELQDPRTAALLAPTVPPLVSFVERLAEASERVQLAASSSSAHEPLLGLDEDDLDRVEASLAYVLDCLCGSWLLKMSPDAAPPLLAALWRHSRSAPPAQLRRFVATCHTLLEAARAMSLDAALMAPLSEGLVQVMPELLSRLLLASANGRAASDFGDDAEERWRAGVEEGAWGGDGLATAPAAVLQAMWCGDGLGGSVANMAPTVEEDDEWGIDGDDGFDSLVSSVQRLLFVLGGTWSPQPVISLLGDALATALAARAAAPPADATRQLHVHLDVVTAAGCLGYVLPAAAAAVRAPLTDLPLSTIVQVLLGAVSGEPPRHHLACRAELSLLESLHTVSVTLLGAAGIGADAAAPAVDAALASCVSTMLARAVHHLPEAAGGGVTSRSASSLLLRLATNRWPSSVHEAGGLRQLSALGGDHGSLSAHAAAHAVPPACWPKLFAAVVGALLTPPRGARPVEYVDIYLPEARRTQLHTLLETMVAPLRAPPPQPTPGGGDAGTSPLALGAPASCLTAVVTSIRDAPLEARTALDAALRAALLDSVLQTQLASLPLVRPPPLGAICSLLRLLRALTRSVGGTSLWGSDAAATWALSAALQSISLAADAQHSASATRAEREGVLEAALELVVSATSERRAAARAGGAGGGEGALVSQVLEVCGPNGLGGLLMQPAGTAANAHEPTALLSPPLRELLLSLADALLTTHWKVVGTHEPALTTVMQLLAAGLMQPADRPAFRQCLPAVRTLHSKWAGGGKVNAARAALAGALGGGAGGAAGAGGVPPPSAALQEQASHLRDLILAARLDPSHAPLHEEAAATLYAALKAASGGSDVRATLCELIARRLHAETWLSAEIAAKLVGEMGASDVGDEGSFGRALSQLASDVSTLRAEAERSGAGF